MAALAAAPAALQPLPSPGGAFTRRLHAPQLQRPTRGRAPAAVAGAGAAPVGGGAGESAGAPPPGLAAPLADDHLIEDHTAAAAAAPSSNSKPTGNGKPHLPSSIYVPFPKDALPPDGHTLTLKVRPGRRRAAQLARTGGWNAWRLLFLGQRMCQDCALAGSRAKQTAVVLPWVQPAPALFGPASRIYLRPDSGAPPRSLTRCRPPWALSSL